MPDQNTNLQRIDESFQRMRQELEGISSVRPQVEQRIAAMPIKSGRRMPARLLAICLALAALGILFWRSRGGMPAPLPHEMTALAPPQDLTLKVGDVEVVEHIAAIMDHGAVAVIWSYRGRGVMPGRADTTEHRAGKYRGYTLREDALADGRTVVCSLFIADEGVRPALEPPALCTRSADDGVIALSASPRPASAGALADAIRSAGFDGKSGIGVDDILREIGKQTH
ncbi:MAG: hypothetical protein JWN24_686 [Phycisphaerales bacterium]|nr:hypothetical protein [Phycisphaerales bacterium]